MTIKIVSHFHSDLFLSKYIYSNAGWQIFIYDYWKRNNAVEWICKNYETCTTKQTDQIIIFLLFALMTH